MNFNIYISDELARQLDLLVEETHIKRNKLIQKAIADLVKDYKQAKWPDNIMEFQGIKISEWNGFEHNRRKNQWLNYPTYLE